MSDYTVEHTKEVGDTRETTRIEGLSARETSELVGELLFDEESQYQCTFGPNQACDKCSGYLLDCRGERR